MPWLLLLFVVVVGLVFYMFLEARKNYPPGPFSIPLLGSWEQRKLAGTLVHLEMEKWGEKYGNLIFFKLLGNEPQVVLRGYELIKTATAMRQFSGVSRATTFTVHGLHRHLGIIFSDGENWHQMRRFSLRVLRDMGFGKRSRTDNINQEVSEVLEYFGGRGEDVEIPVHGAFSIPAANSLMQLAVGTKFSRDGSIQNLIKLIEVNMQQLGPSTTHLNMFPWLKYVAPELSGYRAFCENVTLFVERFRDAVAEHAARLRDKDEPQDLVDAYIQIQRQGDGQLKHIFTDDNLCVVLKDIMIAGLETVGASMEWIMMQLALRPDVQSRAAAEVLDVVGRERRPRIEDMAILPYVQAVIDETQRYHTIAPVVQHAILLGDVELKGFHIPNHCRVLYDIHSIHFDPEFWGDPDVFRPERFLGDGGHRARDRLVPFGLGLRRCLGETHAKQALFLFTTGILQKLEILPPASAITAHLPAPSLVLRAPHFSVRVRPRQ